ncbi:MAG: hypothetical protein ABJH68_01085 [Ilumatobacter sp.]|uniref:hypothetical protein n=1 Tax=Ilumatobacter sp. TaxID=1967498 RepID=UPI0032975345
MTDLLTTAALATTSVEIDPLLAPADAEAINRAVLDGGPYGLYAAERSNGPLESGVTERYDAARNYVATGGYLGVSEPPTTLIRRTGYFRSTLMQGGRVVAPGFEVLDTLPALYDAARDVHAKPVVEPAILYLNLLVPGQELAIHIDVPEFAGADRSITPQWLLVIMRASGLFEDLRVPIATGITYFGHAPGGALRHYPHGPDMPCHRFEPSHNTALVLDTDSRYHGVERVGAPDEPAPVEIVAGATLQHDGSAWVMASPSGDELRRYGTDEVRISISWKAYCFDDADDAVAFEAARGSLTIAEIERRLVDDLRDRGLIGSDASPYLPDIVDLLIDTYQRFPVLP